MRKATALIVIRKINESLPFKGLYWKLKKQLFLTTRQCTFFQALAKFNKFKVDNFKVLYNCDSFQGDQITAMNAELGNVDRFWRTLNLETDGGVKIRF